MHVVRNFRAAAAAAENGRGQGDLFRPATHRAHLCFANIRLVVVLSTKAIKFNAAE